MIELKKGLFEGDGVLTQGFGENPEAYAQFGLKGHNGIDYGIKTGTKLYSCIDGEVTEVEYDQYGYGSYIKIENDTCGVIYAHMKAPSFLKVGESVKAGDHLGISGNTGNSTGPHLHFGVFPKPRDRQNGYAGYIDPFDKKLVKWVDDAPTSENVPQGQLEALQAKLEAVEKELEDMRKSRNEWKELSGKQRAEIKTLKDQLDEANLARHALDEAVIEAQAKISKLQEALITNKTPLSEYNVKDMFGEIWRRIKP